MSNVDLSAVPHLARHAALHPDHVAFVYENREVTYREFHRIAGRFAAHLRADGIGPGDRVAYAGLNSLTFFTAYFGAIWVGAAFVPLNFRLAGAELNTILTDARPDVIVAEPLHAALVDPFLDDLEIRRPLLVDDDACLDAADTLSDEWESFRAFQGDDDALVPHARQDADDLAVLLYTSGTTGVPKGVMLTHGNLWWNWVNVDSVVDTRVGDVSLAVAPLFHIGGLNAVTLRTITRGGTVVVRRAFDPAQALDDIVTHGVNTMFVVPAMLAAIEKQPGFADADLTRLRSTIAAGAPVPPSLIASYADRGVSLQQAWGLTETAPFSTYLEADKTTEKLGSCGVPMPYTEVRIVDPETGREAPAGDTGEMWVRGPNVSSGYWNRPEATQKAFTPDGWFRTGDIGYVDDDGYFFIVDRLKDMIISGGENIYPAEIENALAAHPLIDDVAVIGVPDEKWGEAVCAVVKTLEGRMTLDEVQEFAGRSIARYKLPRRLILQAEIPRNGAGKLDKPRIRDVVAEYLKQHTDTGELSSFTSTLQVPTKKR